MRITALSGFGVKGPACFLIEIEDRRFILDLGAGPDLGLKPNLENVGRVDAVLLSHAHPDHVGALDLLAQLGHPPVYATALVHHFAQTDRFGTALPLDIGGTTDIEGVEVMTGRAGHAPGGIWMRIGGADGVLYTGDFCNEGLLFRPDPMPPAALVIADASYGTYDAPLSDAENELAVVAEKGPVLFPVPAGGRGLEMALVFDAMGHRVGLCPAHFDVARAILETSEGLPDEDARSLANLMARVEQLQHYEAPDGIMIAAKPNANDGLAGQLLERWAGRNDWNIVFTGHLARSTPARTLVDCGRARFVRWNVHPRLRDLIALVEHVKPHAILPAFLSSDELPRLAEYLPVPAMGPILGDVTKLQSKIQMAVVSLG
ncbi:MBL fold metallo-hydrolase [Pelagibacterium lentulum]|uniref:MBL fold metallo-hydrolase n=1 Tax=Pelagibacterium lentulum TaxID=2029865 RepID=A0A916RMZ2_9HYPH|nr:MBL fold metallo-hydrolase [Pelagibacterium lentulum]GGA62514.1 MBL fold metallo-hydrolase [Pelagibacterium lentulum]